METLLLVRIAIITNFSKFYIQDIPCLVPESRDHDILVLMSYDCVTWKQISHERSHFEDEKTNSRRVLLNFLPKYISLYTRYRMTSLNVGPGGGSLPTHDEVAKVHFPPGALKKLTNVMIQTFPVPKFFCPPGVAVGPVLSLEPRRRRFHQNVNYYLKGPDGVDQLLGSHHCRNGFSRSRRFLANTCALE